MQIRKKLIATSMIMGLAVTSADAKQLFVGAVPMGEQGEAYPTIAAAVAKVEAGDTIYLRAGRYHEFVDMTDIKGNEHAPIVITQWNNEHVTIDGSKPVADIATSEWTLIDDANAHPNCENNCYKITVDQPVWQLWDNERMQVVARWPNVTVGHPTDPIRLKDDRTTPEDNSWWDLNGTWGHMANNWNHDTSTNISVVENDTAYNDLSVGADASVSFTGGNIILNYYSETQFSREILQHNAGSNTIEHDGVLNPYDKGRGHFLVEAKGALDLPGEWYYDKDSKEIWYWPEDGQHPSSKLIRGKTQSYAFNLSGTEHVIIDGLRFFGTTVISEESNKSDFLTISNNQFLYPSWYRRMLGENIIVSHMRKPEGGGQPEEMHHQITEVGATILIGDNMLIENNEFAYSDGRVDLTGTSKSNPINNRVINNLFHHWGFSGMSGLVLLMNKNKGSSEQAYNTFHTHGGQVMAKGTYVDVSWSRASYWGYFRQDGVAFQCAGGSAQGGGGSDGTVRHHIWIHNSQKPAVRWDGTDGINGTDHHIAGANVPSLTYIKGDYHKVYHMSGVLSNDPTTAMLKIIDDNYGPEERNKHTRTFNNVATLISGDRTGYVPLNGIHGHNWNGALHTDFGDTADAQLRDPNNLDFRPSADSELINQGTVLTDISQDIIDGAPDIGAYEYGSEHYWIPGYRHLTKANSPIPMNQSLSAKPDADLIFLASKNAIGHKVYLGSSPDNLSLINSTATFANNIVDVGTLQENTTYYWRVDSIQPDNTVVEGDVWQFHVAKQIPILSEDIVVSADTDVRSTDPDKNYGSETQLFVRLPDQTTDEKISYLKFDVDVPGTITQATLRLHTGPTKIPKVEVYSVSDNQWLEDTMTWNNRVAVDGPLLDTNTIFKNMWADFDVTDAVTGGQASLALKLQFDENIVDKNRKIDSRESSFAPYLEVVYLDGDVDLPPRPPKNIDLTTGLKDVTIQWTASHESDIAGYRVYRRQSVEDFFVTPLHSDLLTTTSFSDEGLFLGLPFQYVVKAVDNAGQISNSSVVVVGQLYDVDADGMSDRWESVYLLDTNSDDGTLDADGDGYSNLEEYLADSLPNDSSSTPVHTIGATVFLSDFETRFGNWTRTGGTRRNKPSAFSGEYGAKIRKSSNITTQVDISGYSHALLSYARRTAGMDVGEGLSVSYSVDNINWILLEMTDDTQYGTVSFDLPSASSVWLKFETNANRGKEFAELDDIKVLALP